MWLNKYNRRAIYIAKKFRSSSAATQQSSSEIKLPMRIKRGPTDILKALASTVKEDETAYPYKFYDDPGLLPGADMSKRINALSKEAGRQAANYIICKFPTLFMWDQDEPRMDVWRPKGRPPPEAEESLNETLLLDRIERCWVTNAISIYERLRSENKQISRETRLKLLELICFYNCEEPVESEWTEQMFYRSFLNAPNSVAPWKSNGPAMKLFEEIEIKDSRAYSAVLCGMAKFKAHDQCRPLYEKMVDANFKPDLNTFHALLKCVQFTRSKPKDTWDSIENILTSIRDNNIRPTVVTFNLALFAVVNRLKGYNDGGNRCLQIFREMLSLGIKPSLATYYCLLNYNENDKNIGSYVEAIFNMMENEEHEMCMDEDNLFFPYAMSTIADRLRDVNLAYRLHYKILKYGKNYLFLNDSESEKYYYDRFFILLSRYEETTKFLNMYRTLVPRVYSPSAIILSEFISNLEMTGAVDRIPEIYDSILHLGYGLMMPKIMEIIKVMYSAGNNLEMDVKRSFAETAYKIKEVVDAQYNIKPKLDGTLLLSPRRVKWNGRMIGGLAVILARGGQFQRSFNVFEKAFPPKDEEVREALIEKGTFPEMPPDIGQMNEYVRLLFAANQIEKCYLVLKFMMELGYKNDVSRWVTQLTKSATIHSSERNIFKNLLSITPSRRLEEGKVKFPERKPYRPADDLTKKAAAASQVMQQETKEVKQIEPASAQATEQEEETKKKVPLQIMKKKDKMIKAAATIATTGDEEAFEMDESEEIIESEPVNGDERER